MVDKNFLVIVFLVLQVSPVSSFPESGATGANLAEQRHLRFRREQKIDCEKLLGGVTLQQIINAECTQIKPASGQLEINIVEKPNNWDNFAANLNIIEGITFVFENSHLQEVAFPKLQSAKSSGFNFTNNPQLTSITIKTTSCLNASLDILDNPSLTTVTLAAIPKAEIQGKKTPDVVHTHTVRINKNPELKTIDMFEIEDIIIEGEFDIKDNVKLEEIRMGFLENVGVIKFDLSGNKALKAFVLPRLNSFIIHDSASIKKNDKLSMIYFNRRMKNANVESFEIVQNKKLAVIEMDYMKAPILKVRGNPNLPMGILTQLDTIQSNNKDIQEVGECIFDKAIEDFADLDDCVIINSPVRFTRSTSGKITNNKLKMINGDVYLANLTRKEVDFLTNVKINGTIRSDVCDFQLGNHIVATPATCPSTTVTKKTPITPAAIGPKNRHAHKRTSSARPAIKIHNCETIFVPVYAVIFVVVMTTFACRYIQVPAGGDETGDIELYKRVFPSCNKRKPDIEKGGDAPATDMNQVATYGRQQRRRPVWEQRTASTGTNEVPQMATAPSRPSQELKEAAMKSNVPRTTAL